MPKPSVSSKYSSRMIKILKWSGIVAVPLLLLAAIAYWLIIPNIAEKLVRQQLERAGTRLGLEITTGGIQTSGWQGVIITDLKVALPEQPGAIATIGEVRASLDKSKILLGEKVISSITLFDAELHVIRMADGSLNVDHIRDRIQKDDERDATSVDDAELAPDQPGFLRYFGGKWPDVEITRGSVLFDYENELARKNTITPWPLEKIHAETARLDGSRNQADFTTKLDFLHATSTIPGWKLPHTVDIALTLRAPWKKSTGQLDFDPPLNISGLEPFPFLSAGIGGISIDHNTKIEVKKLTVGIDHKTLKTNVIDVPNASVQLSELSRDIQAMRILELIVDSPTISMTFATNGTNTLTTLLELVRPAAANAVIDTARRAALDISTKTQPVANAKNTPPADDTKKSTPPTPGTLAGIDWPRFIAEKAPGKVVITNATINAQEDRRQSHIILPGAVISLTNGELEMNHRPLSSELSLKASFQAKNNIHPSRGTATINLLSNYRSGKIEAHSDIKELDLSWLSQLLPPSFSTKLHGGAASLKFDIDRKSRDERATFSGNVVVQKAKVFLSLLAEEPLADLNVGYEFEGYFDPKATIPELSLGKKGPALPNTPLPDLIDDDIEQDSAQSPTPTRGAIVFTTGKARVDSVNADVLPAIYGISKPAGMPARFDLKIQLPDTPMSALIEAVPAPIQGTLAGIRLGGSMSWDFAIEVPLHDARSMVWETKPVLNNFEVIHLPPAVDVFKLADQFSHTITDEFERNTKGRRETVEYSRQITIPAMKPTPASWLLENTPLTLQQIDRDRRQRDWPHVPHSHETSIPAHVLNSPQYWLTDHAANQAAKLPWKKRVAAAPKQKTSISDQFANFFNTNTPPPADPSTIADTDDDAFDLPEPTILTRGDINSPNPYGPYQFVPLHHISPWLVRAIITTEDNSFFTHHGFNWLAIKESVHANLRAGRYVRGASTISMQLAKNLFLDRSKVLSRKFQEVFIVWLMEDVADIPKERLMEIYLNIIEFGPGVFGIHDASVHYFGKRPDELSLSEVIWLVSIVPSPKRHHAFYERGEITESWFRRMTRYMRVMHSRDRVSEQQYLYAIEDRPLFYKPGLGAPLLQPRVAPPMIIAPEHGISDTVPKETEDKFLPQFKIPEFSP